MGRQSRGTGIASLYAEADPCSNAGVKAGAGQAPRLFSPLGLPECEGLRKAALQSCGMRRGWRTLEPTLTTHHSPSLMIFYTCGIQGGSLGGPLEASEIILSVACGRLDLPKLIRFAVKCIFEKKIAIDSPKGVKRVPPSNCLARSTYWWRDICI